MRNERKRFERHCKKMLKHIVKTGALPDLDDYSKECLYHCVHEKDYVTGLVAARMASGRVVFEQSRDHLILTKAGLDFCWKPIPWEFPINILLVIATIISTTAAVVQAVPIGQGQRDHTDLQVYAWERAASVNGELNNTWDFMPIDKEI